MRSKNELPEVQSEEFLLKSQTLSQSEVQNLFLILARFKNNEQLLSAAVWRPGRPAVDCVESTVDCVDSTVHHSPKLYLGAIQHRNTI